MEGVRRDDLDDDVDLLVPAISDLQLTVGPLQPSVKRLCPVWVLKTPKLVEICVLQGGEDFQPLLRAL